MSITYVGDYSALDVTEIGKRVERGVPFSAPREWALKMLSGDPRQWETDDEGLADEAAALIPEVVEEEVAMPAEETASMPDGQ